MKRLTLDPANKKIAGVCAGLASYFNIDIALMRVLFFVAALCGSFGFWMYIILWIVVPEEHIIGEPIDITPKEEPENKKIVKGTMIAGLILVFIGLLALIDNFIYVDWIWKLWPVILIIIGVVILINTQKNNNYEQ